MNRFGKIIMLLLALAALAGCSSNYYNVPRDSYERRVRVLGVAPIMIDADSDIRHPEKEAILKLLLDSNRRNEKELVELLRNSGEYAAVRYLEEDAGQLFGTIFSRRERRDDANVRYNKYFYKPDELKKFVARQNVDAVLLVTVSGITTFEKIYASNLLSFLEDNFNSLIMTAQILDGDGNLLWEYPNFRQQFIAYTPMFALQYPDFDEAKANMTDQVAIKNKTLAGIGRAFGATKESAVKGPRQVAVIYAKQFSDMMSFLQYFRLPYFDKKPDKPAPVPSQTQPAEPVRLPPPTQPAAQPARVEAPAPAASAPRQLVPAIKPEPGVEIIREPEIK